jgi:hypothetical protein
MSYIKYSFTNVARLDTMAATGPGVMAGGSHPLPATAGFYLIRNSRTDNRYIGKAGDLKKRFDGRMLTVNELGLRTADLLSIDVFWGIVALHNTLGVALPAPGVLPPAAAAIGGPVAPVIGVTGAGPAPARATGAACPAPNYGAPMVTATVDGRIINVEALLIRYFMTGGFGGTITNLTYGANFHNPTPNRMDVMVEWGAGVTTGIPAGHHELQIAANSSI